MKISVNLIQRNDEFVANCPELDISCFAKSKSDAIFRMQNIISFYIESAQEYGLDVESMTELVIDGEQHRNFEQSNFHAAPATLN